MTTLTKLQCIDYGLEGLFVSDKRPLRHSLGIKTEDLLLNHKVTLINTKTSFRYPVSNSFNVNSEEVQFDVLAKDNDLSVVNAIELEADIDYLTHQNLWNNSETINGFYYLNKPSNDLYYGWRQSTKDLGLNVNDTLTFSFKMKLNDGVINKIGLHCGGMQVTSFYIDGVNKFKASFVGSHTQDASLIIGKEVDIQIGLKVTSTSLDSISIQPNRGFVDTYSAEVSEVQLEKGSKRTEWKLSLKENPPIIKGVSLRLMVPQYFVKTENKAVEFLNGVIPVKASNMLYPRLRLGFPSWSAIYKNSITNTSKLLEPLLTPMYDAYSKLVEYSGRSLRKMPYRFKIHKSLYKPTEVYKLKEKEFIPMTQGNIQTMPKLINSGETLNNLNFSRMFLAPRERLSNYDLKPFLNTTLYLRLLDNSVSSSTVTIKGIDLFGRYCQETISISPMFYTTTNKKYKDILEFQNGSEIVVSNYLDCKYDNYVIQEGQFKPAIVDNNFRTFHPYVSIIRNEEDTRDTLCISDSRLNLKESMYTFNMDSEKIDSVFINEHLNVFWKEDSYLYSGTIHHDLTKVLGHTSNNANDVILVSNKNTSVGDWIEATIDIQKWGSRPMVIQIKNKESTLYYDQNSESFKQDLVYLYPDQNEPTLELSVKVANEDPYIFSVYDDSFENVFVASSTVHMIKSIQKVEVVGDLYHYDGDLILVDGFEEPELNPNNSEDALIVTILPEQNKSYDWSLNLEGHILSPHKTTMDSELYSVKSLYGEDNLPVVFELPKKKLLNVFNKDSLSFTLSLWLNDQYTFKSSSFKLYLSDAKGTIQQTVSSGVTLVNFTSTSKEIKSANKD